MLASWTCHCGQPNIGASACSACLNAAPPSVVGAAAVPVVERRRPSLAVRATAVATVLLLVAGVVAAGLVSRDHEGGRAAATTPAPVTAARTVEVTPDSVPAPGASPLERALPGLLRFTAKARGLAFVRPVRVTLLDDADFRARLKQDTTKDAEKNEKELRTTQRVLEGLGLLEKGLDLKKAIDSLYGDAVAGFYDVEKDDLVVRGERLTPGVRVTLVHELTHALQDQHFDIDRKDLDDRDDEASEGLQGLVEGDAVRIQRIYAASLSRRERKAAEREDMEAGGGIDPGLPPVLLQLVAFPYLVGPEFTTAVVAQGGQERLDAAFATPPTTSEELLHPESFLGGEVVDAVETPKADGEEIDQGVLGELGLLLVLNSTGVSGRTAAAGWGGDRYIAWKSGDATCVRTTIAMDTPQDDGELRKALDRLAASRQGVEVAGHGPFTVTSCS